MIYSVLFLSFPSGLWLSVLFITQCQDGEGTSNLFVYQSLTWSGLQKTTRKKHFMNNFSVHFSSYIVNGLMHDRQNRCPQLVCTGSLRANKQIGHLCLSSSWLTKSASYPSRPSSWCVDGSDDRPIWRGSRVTPCGKLHLLGNIPQRQHLHNALAIFSNVI